MTVSENVALPIEQFTDLVRSEVAEMVRLELSLVGLGGVGQLYPEQISGGMQRRVGLARALALDPQILFFDEPAAGLDPVISHRLNLLILELRNSFGATVVIVSHDVRSIYEIGDLCIFIDPERQSILAAGPPRELARHPPSQQIAEFFGTEAVR